MISGGGGLRERRSKRVGLRERLSGRGSFEGERKYEWWVEGNDKWG